MSGSRSRECRVVLMGMMGSGKTTVGHFLAARTGWPYHDNDALLERVFGGSARQLLAQSGEQRMHADEARALRLGLDTPAPCFIGAAAATVSDAASRTRLERAIVVWLRARPETLADRVAGDPHRPFLATDAVAWMRATAAERDPLYRAVADIIVDVDDRPPEQIADELLARLAGFPACASLQRSFVKRRGRS
jgi:shikimate kinase